MAWKSFFNTRHKQKLVYGELCINKVFGEVQKKVSDITYSANTLSSNGITDPTHVVFSVSSWLAAPSPYANTNSTLSLWGAKASWSTIVSGTYSTFSLSNNNDTLSECRSDKYKFVVSVPSTANFGFVVGKDSLYMGDRTQSIVANTAGLTTGEVTFSVCDGSTVTAPLANINRTTCYEIAKIQWDKRSGKLFYLKCQTLTPGLQAGTNWGGNCSKWSNVN